VSQEVVEETLMDIDFLYTVPFESHAWNTTLCAPADMLRDVLIEPDCIEYLLMLSM
jgi:hypothetical protein